MKIRKGFVTNSSSTNFGTMLVSSIGSVGIASILNIFNMDKDAKDKSYVRLVVEAPESRILSPGNDVPIDGEVVKVQILDGEVGDPATVAPAEINCVNGINVIEGSDREYRVTTDMDKIKKFGGSITFEVTATYENKEMSTTVVFNLATFSIDPMSGVFVVGLETEKEVELKTNSSAIFTNNVQYELLETEVLEAYPTKQNLKLTEHVVEPENLFNKHVHTVVKTFIIGAEMGSFIYEKNYTAKLLKESILVPKILKEPIIVHCYDEKNKDKRLDKAFELPIKVVKYNKDIDNLKTDIDLTNNLAFEFYPKSKQGHLTNEQVKKVVNDANLTVELVPNDGAATIQKPYARYRIYANGLAEAELEKIDIILMVTSDGENIDDITLNVQLMPKIDIKGLIRQFIAYPEGTLIGSLICLGNVDTYMAALDYISEIKVKKTGNPNYEPNENVMYLNRIPKSIEEFKLVQTIHHEIAHIIEIQHDDSEGSTEWNERHSYFIQYLSDTAKYLSTIERGASDVENYIEKAIAAYDKVYYNIEANATEPANVGEISGWFGVTTPTQHQVFDKYLNFGINYLNSSITDEVKERVERAVAASYFPGNIMGRWKEIGGLFDGMQWRISWGGGNLMNFNLDNSQFRFKQVSKRWVGGNQLKLEIKFFVTRLSDGDEDDLLAVLDGGTFNPASYAYPKVNSMTLTWKAGRITNLSECILGDYRNKVVKLTR